MRVTTARDNARPARSRTTPTPQQFLEGLYGLPSGESMPAGIYGWLIQFPSIASPNWRGKPWTGGDPLVIPGFGWRGTWEGQNVYASVSSFQPEADGEMGRRKHLFTGLHAVMIDDVVGKVEATRALALPPSYYVETSPNNFQSWLFLAEPEFDRDRAEALIDSMVRDGLAAENDPGMRGVSRVGRPPFGWNDKPAHVARLGKPFDVRLMEWQPDRRYSVEEVIRHYDLRLEPPRKRRAGPPKSAEETSEAGAQFNLLLRCIAKLGLYKREQRNGWHEITCPWADEHTHGRDDGAALSEPCEANNWRGGYRCHHGHCERRGISDVWRVVSQLMREGAR